MAVLAGLALACAGAQTLAQDLIINTFDSEDEATWRRWWGSAGQFYEFDPSVDANGNANSGSLKATIDFDLAAYGGDNQFAVLHDFTGGTVDGTKYTNLVFDLRWAASSPKNTAGNFGYLEYGFRNPDWSQTWLGGMSVTAGDTWVTVKAAINPATPKIDALSGVVLKMWSGGGGGLTGQATFWVDNVRLLASVNVEPQKPVLSIQPATPGLLLAATAANQQWQRQSIHTLAADTEGNPHFYSWLGVAEPVTYSVTIKEYPDAAHNGFQTHIFLAPESSMPYGPGDSSVDWNAGHVIFLQIGNNADGTGFGRFMYKTNQPGGNSMLWNADPANGPVGTLATIGNPTPLGTWSVTIKNDTDITLTTPSGTSTNFAMPAEAAALFADPLFAYFGIQPNQLSNIGQSALLSRVQIAGVATPLDDNFAGVPPEPGSAPRLDPNLWGLAAADASGVVLAPPDSVYWLKWPAPSLGFVLQSSAILKAGAWADAGLANVMQIGGEKAVLVPAAKLPSTRAGFFVLIKP
jgi:hypothetical protein